MPPETWSHCLALAGHGEPVVGQLTVCQLPVSVVTKFKRSFHQCRQRLGGAASTGANARLAVGETAKVVASAFTAACEFAGGVEPESCSLRNRTRLARRADAWMRDHLGESFQVTDLCLALQVSRRELEYAFRQVFDQSPRDHLQALRLNAIRRAILRSEGDRKTIITIAHDHGVTHLGRFAARYRGLFGERPSDTRRG